VIGEFPAVRPRTLADPADLIAPLRLRALGFKPSEEGRADETAPDQNAHSLNAR
jgi:hypothetical protein